MINRRFFLLGIFVLVLVAPAMAQFEHPDMKSGKLKLNTVVVLPPHVEVSKIGVKSNEGLIQESQAVEAALPGIVAGVLKDKGCTVVESPFTKEALEKDPELKYALADLQKQFDNVLVQVKKKPKDIRKGRFTMGDEVAKIPSGAEALVFVRAAGQISTGGKKTFAFLVGGPGLYDLYWVDTVVVDARNGNVLYYARTFSTGNVVKEPDRMRKPIFKGFKNFASANPPKGKS